MKRIRKRKNIIPGFGLSFGITITILSLIVLIPLCSLIVFTARLSFSEFIYTITRPRILSGYWVSLSTALIAALVNAFMGVIMAWVLVRYDFPGKKFIDGIIELPFALPTAVAGISLTHLTTTNGWVGKFFYETSCTGRSEKNALYSLAISFIKCRHDALLFEQCESYYLQQPDLPPDYASPLDFLSLAMYDCHVAKAVIL